MTVDSVNQILEPAVYNLCGSQPSVILSVHGIETVRFFAIYIRGKSHWDCLKIKIGTTYCTWLKQYNLPAYTTHDKHYTCACSTELAPSKLTMIQSSMSVPIR